MTLAIDRLALTGRWRRRATAEKAVLALGLLTLAVALPPWPGAALVAAAAWTIALTAAGLRLRDWLGVVTPPLGFAVAGVTALAIEIGPDGIALARDGGRAAGLALLRALAALSCLLLLAATTPTPDLLRGLRRLGLPAEIADIALLIWRFLFLLLDSATAIRHAQEARLGWRGWRRSLRSLGMLVAMLLPQAIERARRMEIGLAARGYDGGLRTLAETQPVSVAFVALTGALLAGLTGVGLWLG